MAQEEKIARLSSPSLSGVSVVGINITDTALPAFDVALSDGSCIPFNLGNPDEFPAFYLLCCRLGVEVLFETDELIGLTFDGDGLTDAQRYAASQTAAEDQRAGLYFKSSSGGSMGGHQALMLDGKCIGHLYIDADETMDVDAVLADIEAHYNAAEKRLEP